MVKCRNGPDGGRRGEIPCDAFFNVDLLHVLSPLGLLLGTKKPSGDFPEGGSKRGFLRSAYRGIPIATIAAAAAATGIVGAAIEAHDIGDGRKAFRPFSSFGDVCSRFMSIRIIGRRMHSVQRIVKRAMIGASCHKRFVFRVIHIASSNTPSITPTPYAIISNHEKPAPRTMCPGFVSRIVLIHGA